MFHTPRTATVIPDEKSTLQEVPPDRYRETIDPYRDCPQAEMRDAQVSVVGAVSIGSFELSR